MTDFLTLKEVQIKLGVPQHVLIHLCEKRVIEPEITDTEGRGKWRKFSIRNLFEFAVALELRKYEIPIVNIRAILRLLEGFERTARKSLADFMLPDSLIRSAPELILYLHDGETLIFGIGRKVYLAFNLTRAMKSEGGQVKPQKLNKLPADYRSQLTINLSKLAQDITK